MEKPVIKIPSKHIYQEDNPKVINNQTDTIEVQINAPLIISATENVYNKKVECLAQWQSAQKKSEHKEYKVTEQTTTTVVTAYAYIEESPSYITNTFIVPKEIANSTVLRILTGKNDNGQSNISYTIRGNISNGTSSGSVTGKRSIASNITYGNVSVNEPMNIITDTNQSYVLTPNITYSKTILNLVTATVDFELDDISTILTAKAEPTADGKSFEITLTILNGLKITKLGGGYNNPSSGDFTVPLNGTYEEYSPTEINISFYGDIFKLDLTNKTLSIGSGNNVNSFPGNELMQTTNTPSIRETYGKIRQEWRDGKEVATLRCGIEDYYTVEKNVNINVTYAYFYDVHISTTDKINIGDTLYLNNGAILTVVNRIDDNQYFCTQKEAKSLALGYYTATIKNKIISNSGENGLPMTLHVGDIVIPYVYGANGQDKPMSLTKDGEPKKFEVLGIRMIYDGAIWQEPTVQEYYGLDFLKENEAEIRLVYEGSGSVMECWVKRGEIKVGDILEYKGNTTRVYEYINNNHYRLAIKLGDEFYNASGETIVVTVINQDTDQDIEQE